MANLTKDDVIAVRRTMFQHLDGIAVGPVLNALYNRGVLNIFLDRNTVTVDRIVQGFGGNAGYINVALRTLACQGWLQQDHNSEYAYKITKRGESAIELAPSYEKVVRFISRAIDIDRLLWENDERDGEALRDLQILVDCCKRRWNILRYQEREYLDVYWQVLDHLDGLLLGPIMVNLAMKGFFNWFSTDEYVLDYDTAQAKFPRLEIVVNLLETLGWVSRDKNSIVLTPQGSFATTKAFTYGIPISYLPTFAKMDCLLFEDPMCIWTRTEDGNESHVDRTINVWSSGQAHHSYFARVDEIVAEMFNRPLAEQPLGIVDMGCGDGTFLKHLYELVKTKTLRGKHLEIAPLLMIGADYNAAARAATARNLSEADIPHEVVYGDINAPQDFAEEIQRRFGIDLHNVLNIRSFLDHNRSYVPPVKEAGEWSVKTLGAYVQQGILIENKQLVQNLIEHFQRWKPWVGKFGLLLVELHIIDPSLAAANLSRTLATPFEAIHGFTDQYPVELDIHMQAAETAGFSCEERFHARFPKSELATISINLFTVND